MRKTGHAGLANLRKPRNPGIHQEAGPKDREVTGNQRETSKEEGKRERNSRFGSSRKNGLS